MFKSPSAIQVTSHLIPEWKHIPNTSIQSKPLMIYHNAFDASASELKKHLGDIGEVDAQWVYSMYRQTHYHSTTHEVLGVVAGRARLCFGGEDNPERVETTVQKGDLIIVPAGVGHRLLDELDSRESFKMVGSYPHDKQWDMCYGNPGEEEKVRNIQKLNWFRQDPLFGANGPALEV